MNCFGRTKNFGCKKFAINTLETNFAFLGFEPILYDFCLRNLYFNSYIHIRKSQSDFWLFFTIFSIQVVLFKSPTYCALYSISIPSLLANANVTAQEKINLYHHLSSFKQCTLQWATFHNSTRNFVCINPSPLSLYAVCNFVQ